MTKRLFFSSKTKAYNAAGSNHKKTVGSYHIHKTCGIRMWTGDLRTKDWVNEYYDETGDYLIGIEAVEKRHGNCWEKIRDEHRKLTFNKKDRNHKFLCFTKGLSPNDYVKFLGVYEDDWDASREKNKIVRKRLSPTWDIPKE